MSKNVSHKFTTPTSGSWDVMDTEDNAKPVSIPILLFEAGYTQPEISCLEALTLAVDNSWANFQAKFFSKVTEFVEASEDLKEELQKCVRIFLPLIFHADIQ